MEKKLRIILVSLLLMFVNSETVYAYTSNTIPMNSKKTIIKNRGIQIDESTNVIEPQRDPLEPVETVKNESNTPTLYASEYYDAHSADPTVINLAPNQFKYIETMEKRHYRTTFKGDKTLHRVERLEKKLLNKEPENNPDNITQRINTLKLASSRRTLAGTAIPASMSKNFRQRDLQSMEKTAGVNDDDVGIIDGLIRTWSPDLYKQLKTFNKLKDETNNPFYYF